jgi:hypothetical protein
MIVVQNCVSVAEGREEAFVARFRGRRGPVDDQPGFVRNMVLRPIRGEHFIRAHHLGERRTIPRLDRERCVQAGTQPDAGPGSVMGPVAPGTSAAAAWCPVERNRPRATR